MALLQQNLNETAALRAELAALKTGETSADKVGETSSILDRRSITFNPKGYDWAADDGFVPEEGLVVRRGDKRRVPVPSKDDTMIPLPASDGRSPDSPKNLRPSVDFGGEGEESDDKSVHMQNFSSEGTSIKLGDKIGSEKKQVEKE